MMIPRLDWQDREFDTQQRSAKLLPRKLVFSGAYTRGVSQKPYLILYDRETLNKSVVKLFKSNGTVTCLSYGPYDNGHILLGTSTGDFIAFDSIKLSKICNIKISETPVTSIAIEWTQLVLIGTKETETLAAVSFIETKEKYVYMELGTRKYATVVINNKTSKQLT